MKKVIILSFLALIFACQNSVVDYSYPGNPENIRKQRGGEFFQDKNLFNNKKTSQREESKVQTKSSSKLWVASVEVLSALLPISTADENSGLIITEWYQDGKNSNDRIKINLLVKNKEPKKENLVLTIFRQTKNDKGVWVDEQSSNQNLSAQMIKDKIIEKAKSN
jgi:hypothetical protein